MPYRPHRVRQRPRRAWDQHDFYQLLSGHTFFAGTGFADETEWRAAWAQFRGPLLACYAAEVPGARPYSWLAFDSPKPRQILDGEENPQSGFAPWVHMPGKTMEEIAQEWPAVFARLWAAHQAGRSQRTYYYGSPNPIQFPQDALYESPARYLRRLGLLLPAEEAIVPQHLDACDAWFIGQYEFIDAHPHPAGGMETYRAFLDTSTVTERKNSHGPSHP